MEGSTPLDRNITCWGLILRHVDASTLASVSCVCTTLLSIVRDNALWRSRYHQDFGQAKPGVTDFYLHYRDRMHLLSNTPSLLASLVKEEGDVTAACFWRHSATRLYICTGCTGGEITLWNLQGERIRSWQAHHTTVSGAENWITRLQPIGTDLLSICDWGMAALSNQNLEPRWLGCISFPLHSQPHAILHDTWLVQGHHQNILVAHELSGQSAPHLLSAASRVTSLCQEPGSPALLGGTEDGTVIRWSSLDEPDGARLPLPQFDQPVTAIYASRNWILFALEQKIQVIDRKTYHLVSHFDLPEPPIRIFASPLLARHFVLFSFASTTELWSIDRGKPQWTLNAAILAFRQRISSTLLLTRDSHGQVHLCTFKPAARHSNKRKRKICEVSLVQKSDDPAMGDSATSKKPCKVRSIEPNGVVTSLHDDAK